MLLTSVTVNFLYLYTLCYDPGEVYGLNKLESFLAAFGFASAASLVAAVSA